MIWRNQPRPHLRKACPTAGRLLVCSPWRRLVYWESAKCGSRNPPNNYRIQGAALAAPKYLGHERRVSLQAIGICFCRATAPVVDLDRRAERLPYNFFRDGEPSAIK